MPIFYRPDPENLPVTGKLLIINIPKENWYIDDYQTCKFRLEEACCFGMYNGLTLDNPIVQFIFHPDSGSITMGDDYLGAHVYFCPFCGEEIKDFGY